MGCNGESRKKVMQFLDGGRYLAVVSEGTVHLYKKSGQTACAAPFSRESGYRVRRIGICGNCFGIGIGWGRCARES
jgi:hypothetical protein